MSYAVAPVGDQMPCPQTQSIGGTAGKGDSPSEIAPERSLRHASYCLDHAVDGEGFGERSSDRRQAQPTSSSSQIIGRSSWDHAIDQDRNGGVGDF